MSSETDGHERVNNSAVRAPQTDEDASGSAPAPDDPDPDSASTASVSTTTASVSDEPTADGFGVRGWALTLALFSCVIVIPGIIYAYPYAAGAFGLPFFATYLVLPFVPAAFLGLIAVWAMTAATADAEP